MMKETKKLLVGIMCLIITVSMMPEMAQADATNVIVQHKVNNYAELDRLVEAGESAYKLQLTKENASVNFTLTEDSYVRVMTVLTKEKGNVTLSAKIKNTSLTTDYTEDASSIIEYNPGVYKCNSYAKLTKGTYTITYADGKNYAGNEVDIYMAVLPANTDFLSLSYVGESSIDSNGNSTLTVKVNHVDEIKELKVYTTNTVSNENVVRQLGEDYTLDQKGQISFGVSKNLNIINVYMVDVCDVTHFVTYRLFNDVTVQATGIEEKIWTGKPLTQAIVVNANGRIPTYNVSYLNNINEGTASVVLQGTGEWLGKITKTFTIKKVIKVGKVKSLKITKAKKKSATLKWKKTTNAVKYEVKYSTSKKFKKAKTKTAKKNTIKIKKLKNNKKYYFKVRAISETGYVGKWSSAKKATIKK